MDFLFQGNEQFSGRKFDQPEPISGAAALGSGSVLLLLLIGSGLVTEFLNLLRRCHSLLVS